MRIGMFISIFFVFGLLLVAGGVVLRHYTVGCVLLGMLGIVLIAISVAMLIDPPYGLK
jgi:hypothetical protein